MLKDFNIYDLSILSLPPTKKRLISTINAHSYNLAKKDSCFKEALLHSDVLIPDGVGIVWAVKRLIGKKIKKIAGADLFFYQMRRLEKIGGKCFFLGSTEETLSKIQKRARKEFPNVTLKTFSPPFSSVFLEEENQEILEKINTFKPDVLFVGMTAPKQEKWAYTHFGSLEVGHVCSIGAVFDFYAGTIRRAPRWMINAGLEWMYRLIKEPKRMWKRYLLGNLIFIMGILKEKLIKQKIS